MGLSGIALPEIISAFCRLRREGQITDLEYQQLKSLLLADIEDAAICDLTPTVLAQAVSCLETNVLRGMDAIHMGSAVALQADVFVSADQRKSPPVAQKLLPDAVNFHEFAAKIDAPEIRNSADRA